VTSWQLLSLDSYSSGATFNYMEIRPSPDQEALIRQAVEAGRFERPEDTVMEALALWEERERARAEFRETLDDAEASLARGEGTEITRESMRELTDGIMERTGAWIAAEQKAAR
jgi:Arc/MetJ-type ribon-helix-helix transcriptional regulator